MKFLCDHMLGTLAKWLRFLGHDTAYPGPLDDAKLKALVEAEGRTLLTRDRELSGRVAGSVYVASDVLDEQLLQVMAAFALPADLSLTRCSLCNTALDDVSKEDARGKVPEKVFEHQERYWHCATCGRYYWQGSHWDHMTARLKALQEKAAARAR